MAEQISADASPTRELFVYMLTRDISLQDCILELIDNCLDGARRTLGGEIVSNPSKAAFKKFNCVIRMTRETFEISDNCGGVPLDIAKNYAFRFGRDPKAPIDKHGVGIYGIGMKRAIFKMGRYAEFHTATKRDSYRVTIDVINWLKQPQGNRWSFPIQMEKPKVRSSTSIAIKGLNEGIGQEIGSDSFQNLLRRKIGRYYAFYIQRGFSVYVNGEEIPAEIFEMRISEKFKPARIKYRDESDVNVEIFAGMASVPPDDDMPSRSARELEPFGWYVFCNERTILAADKSEKTVWGYAGVPDWHSQYSGFKGLVFFRSQNPSLLPWTTTKRDIDLVSTVYRRALPYMRELTKVWTGYTNKRKSDIGGSKTAERQTKPVSLLELPTRKKLVLPKAKITRTLVNIHYQKPVAEVKRAQAALGNSGLSNREVGERTFEYFLKREVDD